MAASRETRRPRHSPRTQRPSRHPTLGRSSKACYSGKWVLDRGPRGSWLAGRGWDWGERAVQLCPLLACFVPCTTSAWSLGARLFLGAHSPSCLPRVQPQMFCLGCRGGVSPAPTSSQPFPSPSYVGCRESNLGQQTFRVLRAYSWLLSRCSEDHIGGQGSNPGQPYARPASSPLSCCSGHILFVCKCWAPLPGASGMCLPH